MLKSRPTPGLPNSIAPLDVSDERSPPVTTIGTRLILLALKLVPELFVICVQLGIVAVADHELKITGASRVIFVVSVIPVHWTILTHERVHPVVLIGD